MCFSQTPKLRVKLITVTQLNQSGENTKSYQFHYMWPTELAPIPLDWSSDMVEEYSVTFAVNHWSAAGGAKTSNKSNQEQWGVEISADSGGVDGSIWATIRK